MVNSVKGLNPLIKAFNLQVIHPRACYSNFIFKSTGHYRILLFIKSGPIKFTGLFISPSGNSELDCVTTKTDTAERSISIGRESLQVFFCTRDLGVLPGSPARGSRDEKWRSQ